MRVCDNYVDVNAVEINVARLNHCKEAGNAWQSGCGRFDSGQTLADADIEDARDIICVTNAVLFVAEGSSDNAEAGKSLFSGLCDGRVAADARTVVTERANYCTVGDNIFDEQCGDADLYGGTNAARQTACNTIADAPLASVGANNCVSRAEAICGDDDNAGDNPFAAICRVATQNINYFAELTESQQDYCGLPGNNAETVCDTTVASVCAPGGTNLATNEIFADICARATYNDAKVAYCSNVAMDGDTDCDKTIAGAGGTIKAVLCDGTEVSDNPHATVCGTDNVAEQRTFCALDHSVAGDPTACAATRTVACADTDGNPFDTTLCFEENNIFDAQRKLRADACLTEAKTGPDCTDVATCNAAPFGETTPTSGVACSATIYAEARTMFCTVGADIFNTNCAEVALNAEDKIAGTQAARQAACAQSGATAHAGVGTANCVSRADAICGTNAIEGTNPFAFICSVATQNVNYSTDYLLAQDFYCLAAQGNLGNHECPNVTSGDWLNSFTGEDALANDPTGDADSATRNNEFLAITNDEGNGKTISTAGTATETSGSTAPTPETLNFGAIKYKTQDLGLGTDNGLAFFTGFFGDDTLESAYAGIYETTDLGGPIVDDVTNATWSGALRILDDGTLVESDFDLNVTFSGGADGRISAFIADVSGNKDFNIDGTFGASGVLLTGSRVYYGELPNSVQSEVSTEGANGDLSGIIGQNGAIGVFVSDNNEDLYAGGFVASGVCSTNIFAEGCSLKDDPAQQAAFCLNVDDNNGRNIFNPLCIEATGLTMHGTEGQLKGLRDAACLVGGDAADGTCKERDEVRRLCNENPFTLTSLTTDGDATICTGMDAGGVTYASLRTNCETPGTSFATSCDVADTTGSAVETARDTACLDATLNNAPHNACLTRTEVVRVCTLDPFTRTGCANVGTIATLTRNYCFADATLWNDRCDAGEAGYSGVTAKRDEACLAATANNEPDADCLTRTNVVNTCTTDPFTRTGCANVTTIATLTRNYCFADATLWNDRCDAGEAGYSGVTAKRDEACLAATANNEPDADCLTRTNVVNTCTTDPFTRTGCANVTTIATLTRNYCFADATLWNDRCDAGEAGYSGVTAKRDEACLAATANNEPDADCLTRTNVVNTCTTDPFTRTGCANVTTIATLTRNYCFADATLWNDRCDAGEAGYSGVTAKRDEACLAATANNEPDADCLTRTNVVNTCTTDPFTRTGCANVTTIATLTRNYCFADATLWNDRCDAGEAGYSGVTAKRDEACLAATANNEPDADCLTRTNVVNTCTTDPFTRTGCANVTTIATLTRNYCFADATLWNDRCDAGEAGYSGVTAKRDEACLAATANNEPDADCLTRTNVVNTCTTDPFTRTGCANVTTIATLTRNYCFADATLWNDRCDAGEAGYSGVTAKRDEACLAATANNEPDADCLTRTNVVNTCTTDPFTRTGCANVTTIATLTRNYCFADATLWNDRCDAGEAGYSGVTAKRDEACLAATANNEPDADCLTRTNVVNTCTTDPFTRTGCANVTTIATLTRNYCFADATLWNDRCDAGEAGYSGVTAKRDEACLAATANNEPDADCLTRTNVVNTCTTDPFTRTGCANVTTIATLTRNYCFADATLWNDRCDAGEAGYSGVTAKRDEACLAATANNEPDADCLTRTNVVNTCTTDPFTRTGCANVTTIGALRRTFCTVTDIFNGSCGNADLYGATNAAREAACAPLPSDGSTGTASDGECGPTVTRICSTESRIFSLACTRTTTGSPYVVARGVACLANTPAATQSGNCRGELDAGFYLHAYCNDSTQANNLRDCPMTYKGNNPALSSHRVTLATLANKALNTDGSALLSPGFIDAEGATNGDPATNFITDGTGDNTVLELQNSVAALAPGFLTLDLLSNVTATSGSGTATDTVGEAGFAFATTNGKFYVGLLHGTALGAPLLNGDQDGTWKARFRFLTAGAGAQVGDTAEYNLTVNFDAKTIVTDNASGMAPVVPTRITSGTIDSSLGQIGINGKFTANGVIYGTVSAGDQGNNPGTLTGLIGQIGAVGIFKSNAPAGGKNATPYVGGFVAAPGNSAPIQEDDTCTDTEGNTPFAPECTEEDEVELQVLLCTADALMRSARVTDYSANCVNNDRVTKHVCDDNGEHANPFHPTLCGGDNLVALGLTEKKNPSLTTAT